MAFPAPCKVCGRKFNRVSPSNKICDLCKSKNIEKVRIKLEKYYKTALRCSMCRRVFGDNSKIQRKICPICLIKIQGKKSHFENATLRRSDL